MVISLIKNQRSVPLGAAATLAMADSSTAISNLVAQLKRGEITRAELYQRLNDLKSKGASDGASQPSPHPPSNDASLATSSFATAQGSSFASASSTAASGGLVVGNPFDPVISSSSQAPSRPVPPPSFPPPPPLPLSRPVAAAPQALSSLSSPDRAQVLKRLIASKRGGGQQQAPPSPDLSAISVNVSASVLDGGHGQQHQHHQQQYQQQYQQQQHEQQRPKATVSGSVAAAKHAAAPAANRPQPVVVQRPSKSVNPSVRSPSASQKAAASELTFQPNLPPPPPATSSSRAAPPFAAALPTSPTNSSNGGNASGRGLALSQLSFEERAARAIRDREERLSSLRGESAQKEVAGCTFNPLINKNSQRCAELFLKKDSRPAAERLYDERLHLAAKAAKREQDKKEEVEREFKEQHTFRPAAEVVAKTAVRRDGTPISSRYRQTGASPSQRRPDPDQKPEECTFTPSVKGVKSDMRSAQLYLQANVFDRLQKDPDAKAGSAKENYNPVYSAASANGGEPLVGSLLSERPVLDMQTFMGNVQQQGASGARRPASASKARPPSPGPFGSSTPRGGVVANGRQQQQQRPSSASRTRPMTAGSPSKTPQETEESRRAFQAFLARQNHTELKKQQKMDELLKAQEQPFKPQLCAGSAAITEGRKQEDFLKRVKQYQVHKDHEEIRLKSQHDAEHECTFAPELTEKTRQLAEGGRSVVELSKGDHLKKETARKMLKLRHEQEQLQLLTFQPDLIATSNTALKAQSVLKIASDPDSYLDRLHKEMKKKKEAVRRKQQEQEKKDLDACTFTPQTSECPGYIKRIARSMALTKSTAAQGQEEPGKPDWR